MKSKIEISFEDFDSIQNLKDQDAKLLRMADDARKNAYAVYSKFQVGSAVLLSNGEIVCGNNQENAAYPSGLCAERVAVFSAMANFPKDNIVSIAVSAQTKLTEPVPPCGACRQVIVEYEKRSKTSIRVIFGHPDSKIRIIESASLLLPFSFDFSHLP